MESKQTAVRSPTGGGRPPVTGFYWNPCANKESLKFISNIVNKVELGMDTEVNTFTFS